MSDRPNMATRSIGRLVAVWHGPDAPREHEWEELLDQLRAQSLQTLRVLVLTEGGAPSTPQKMELTKVLAAHPVPVAVISDVASIRFVASSLALLMKRIRTFPLSELGQAYAHLALEPTEARAADEFLQQHGVTPPPRRGSLPSI